jgi:phosphatidylglycerophosphatase A
MGPVTTRREALKAQPAPFRFWYATWFGTGLSPWAPGTVATLASVPVHFLLATLGAPFHLLVIAAMTAAGCWAAAHVVHTVGDDDPQIVVIDETVSVLLALWIVGPATIAGMILAVALFRVLDIAKPWPIRAAERLRPAALGIMADDLLAGLAAGLLTRLLLWLWETGMGYPLA